MRYLLMSAMLCVMLSIDSFAEERSSTEERPRTITVSGDAEVRVAPNQVVISMAVINKEKTLDAARKANDKTVKALISYFTEVLKIAPKHVQTDYLSVNPVYLSCNNRDEQAGQCDSLEIQYYNLEKGIQLRLDDLSKYEAVIAKSFESGVNKISDIQFVTSELRQHKDKARELAAVAAKEKAQAMSGALGMELGKPITINLNDISWSYRGRNSPLRVQNAMMNMGSSNADGGGSSLAVGQINVTASVTVSFDMQ